MSGGLKMTFHEVSGMCGGLNMLDFEKITYNLEVSNGYIKEKRLFFRYSNKPILRNGNIYYNKSLKLLKKHRSEDLLEVLQYDYACVGEDGIPEIPESAKDGDILEYSVVSTGGWSLEEGYDYETSFSIIDESEYTKYLEDMKFLKKNLKG